MRPFIPWVNEDEATGKVAEIYNLWKSENPDRDSVPYVLKCFSLRPDFLEQVYGFSYKLQFADGYLTRRQKELIGTYVSSLNNCPYCRGSHAYFLECQVGAKTANAVVRDDLDAADMSDAERELCASQASSRSKATRSAKATSSTCDQAAGPTSRSRKACTSPQCSPSSTASRMRSASSIRTTRRYSRGRTCPTVRRFGRSRYANARGFSSPRRHGGAEELGTEAAMRLIALIVSDNFR